MSVTVAYREYVLDQLGRVTSVTARGMFGGVGIYARDLFFALIDDDTVFFKVDEVTRPEHLERGMRPFMPGDDPSQTMGGYYELPGEVLEDVETLRPWVEAAVAVARRAKAAKGRKKRSTR